MQSAIIRPGRAAARRKSFIPMQPSPIAETLIRCGLVPCLQSQTDRLPSYSIALAHQMGSGNERSKTERVGPWGERRGLNPRQPVPQTGALPTELRPPSRWGLVTRARAGRQWFCLHGCSPCGVLPARLFAVRGFACTAVRRAGFCLHGCSPCGYYRESQTSRRRRASSSTAGCLQKAKRT